MARVTVEDCVDKVENQFDLVVIAGHRARQLCAGMQPLLDRNDDKEPVIALREIAEEKLTSDELLEGVTQSYRSHRILDAEEDDFDHLLEPPTQKDLEIGRAEESADMSAAAETAPETTASIEEALAPVEPDAPKE